MGAICDVCQQDMMDTNGCKSGYVVYKDNSKHLRIPYPGDSGRCHDCYVSEGHIHHNGCDMEKCPKCKLQLLGCDCEPVGIESVA